MLLTPEGRRVGTVSGGCLEAEVVSRAWWLTGNGPTIQRYSTADDDGDRPYGSGCGGVVFLLLERRATAGPCWPLWKKPSPCVFASRSNGSGWPADRPPCIASVDREQPENVHQARINRDPLQDLAQNAIANRESIESTIAVGEINARAWADFRPARPGLWIFGAGDDAQPLLRLAKELGLFVSVADGRSHLATRERFSAADQLSVLPFKDLPANPRKHR